MNRQEFHRKVDDLLDQADHTYDSSANAARDLTADTLDLVASELGLTGFQASWAMLSAYGRAMSIDGPFMVVRANEALYPQYDLVGNLAAWLNGAEVGAWLATEADRLLAEKSEHAVESVRAHWRRLAGHSEATA